MAGDVRLAAISFCLPFANHIMFFKNNHDFSHLPKVLAGPILRRVDPDRVCVWIALKSAAVITGQVYARPNSKRMPGTAIASSAPTKTISLGKNLHIALIEISTIARQMRGDAGVKKYNFATDNFPVDAFLCYNLFFQQPDNLQAEARDLRQMMDIDAVVFPKVYPLLPTFFIPSSTGPVNFIQGSCRKSHGMHYDGAGLPHDILDKTQANLSTRPSALFFTGDQIYADDVPDGLINYIAHLGEYLLGFKENIYDARISRDVATVDVIGGQRGLLLQKDEFLSAELVFARNHLMGFGEFVAMYLLAWNPDIWPDTEDKSTYAKVFKSTIAYPEVWRQANGYDKQLTFSYFPDEDEYDYLKRFKEGAELLRRSFGNIATYMIFDDHEITDDWFRTYTWRANSMRSQAGRTLMSNGMVAYWAFQGWGNNPDAFSDKIKFVTPFHTPFEQYFGAKGLNPPPVQNRKTRTPTELLDDIQKRVFEFEEWSFVAPTHPPAVHIDTRTRRHYDTADKPPRLMDANAIGKLKIELERILRSNPQEALLIISPAPVLGQPAMEAIQDILVEHSSSAMKDRDAGNASDVEGWHSNLSGFYSLLLMIFELKPRACVFFSGDVHFSSIAKAELKHRQSGATTIFTQFTSSSLKYRPEFYKVVALKALANKPGVIDGTDYIWKEKPDYVRKKDIPFSEQSPGDKPLILSQVKLLEPLTFAAPPAIFFSGGTILPILGAFLIEKKILSLIGDAVEQKELNTSDYTCKIQLAKFEDDISTFVYTDPNIGQFQMESPKSDDATMTFHAVTNKGKKEKFTIKTSLVKK